VNEVGRESSSVPFCGRAPGQPKRTAKMKQFVPSDYEQILGPYLDTHENIRYCD
jgi:hypothetical protein